jgi:uncharacterized protein (DUF302 family)
MTNTGPRGMEFQDGRVASENQMIYKVTSASPLDEIERRLQESAARQKFGVVAIHDLQEMLKKKGVDLTVECRVYEVCNPIQAKKVLEADGAISTALPCRISVYGAPRNYTLATMPPSEMMKGFDNPEIEPIAREVEDVIFQMMRDAAGDEAG